MGIWINVQIQLLTHDIGNRYHLSTYQPPFSESQVKTAMKIQNFLAPLLILAAMVPMVPVLGGGLSQAAEESNAVELYIPGLGDLMGATQMRHAKLWFAGANGNWDLAAYEVDELREGLADAAHFNPMFKNIPVQAMLEQFTTQPLARLDQAIASKKVEDFKQAFDQLTAACNGCHHAAARGFISITRPATVPLTNQTFMPAEK